MISGWPQSPHKAVLPTASSDTVLNDPHCGQQMRNDMTRSQFPCRNHHRSRYPGVGFLQQLVKLEMEFAQLAAVIAG